MEVKTAGVGGAQRGLPHILLGEAPSEVPGERLSCGSRCLGPGGDSWGTAGGQAAAPAQGEDEGDHGTGVICALLVL